MWSQAVVGVLGRSRLRRDPVVVLDGTSDDDQVVSGNGVDIADVADLDVAAGLASVRRRPRWAMRLIERAGNYVATMQHINRAIINPAFVERPRNRCHHLRTVASVALAATATLVTAEDG